MGGAGGGVRSFERSRPSYRGNDRFWFRKAIHPDDVYTDADDDRLRALVKAAWMRTLYGSSPGTIAVDQAIAVGEYGQGWDRANLETFLRGVPGWKAVSTFLKACQAIGRREENQYGITLRDPFDNVEFKWQPVWRVSRALTTRGTERGFTFAIDRPHTADDRGLRVEKRKLRDCIAPRWVHCLDAALNALVVEKVAPFCTPGAFPLCAVHDAWLMAWADDTALTWGEVPDGWDEIREAQYEGEPEPFKYRVVLGEKALRWALDEAAKTWFEDLGVVYDDLIRLTAGTDYDTFARGIKRTWKRRLEACRAATKPWPTFRAKAVESIE